MTIQREIKINCLLLSTLIFSHICPLICYPIFCCSCFCFLRDVRKTSTGSLKLLLNLNTAQLRKYCKHESWGLMQRLQHYNTVPTLQDLHSCLSDIYLKKNALKKEGKQAPHNLIFSTILQCYYHMGAAAGNQQREVWRRLSRGAVGVGAFPACSATTSPWPSALLTCFATAAPWPFAWGLFLGLLPSMLVHEFQRAVSL